MKTICAQTVIWSPNWYICRDLYRLWPEADEKMTEKLPIIYNVKEEYLAAVLKQ